METTLHVNVFKFHKFLSFINQKNKEITKTDWSIDSYKI